MGLFISVAGRLPAQHCDGHYRWQQKIDDTHLTESATHTTVASMLGWRVPAFSGAKDFWCRARNAREQRVYQVIAWARRLKVESGAKGDGDWHIELMNSRHGNVANCIVIEIPPATLNDAYFTARLFGRFIRSTRLGRGRGAVAESLPLRTPSLRIVVPIGR